ncbi:MAG TPA: DUF5703 family protein [Actinopolymorphaceae bacterium]
MERASEYEIERFELPRTWSRRVVRQLLVDKAEYAGWELHRVRVYPDGRRVVWMRRRIIRAVRTRPMLVARRMPF